MFLLIFWIGCALSAAIDKPACELKSPLHTQPVDSFYKLGVAGDPDFFLPGELYTISLQGIDKGEGPAPFTGFTIWVEKATAPIEIDNSTKGPDAGHPTEPVSLGSFQTYDVRSSLYDKCAPSVINATSHSKTEIQVIWNSPVGSSDVCLRICARAGPNLGNRGGWSMLARRLCPAPVAAEGITKQQPIVEPCCACDEAKYEVTFEGLWSRYTHPREFPPESARAHFGDIIGASHTAQYRVWQEGRVASPGVRRLAEDGATTALEKELKSESEHIRTIIKARGISWQHIVGAAGNTGSTFAVFRADARHHLISLATKLAPSPDWIVGVSALELCNPNCTWRSLTTIPLYPYDAGTDSGVSYTSRREPTVPPGPVRALRPDWPRDPRSPFFHLKGEMRPFASLRLTRLRLYEKNCDAAGKTKSRQDAKQDLGGRTSSGSCGTSTWGSWGPCSVTCGSGQTARQRQYLRPVSAKHEACRVRLTDYHRCYGSRIHCRSISEFEKQPASNTGPCAVSQWSEWSACSSCGVRARTRHYLAPRAHKRCHIGYRARTVLHEGIPCDAGPCERPSNPAYLNDTTFDWFFVDKPSADCGVSEWGNWSPCSHPCGRGRRLRTRLFTHEDPRVRRLLTENLIFKWNQIFGQWQGMEIGELNFTSPDPEVQEELEKHEMSCGMVLTQQEASCEGERCPSPSPSEVCGLPMDVGPCRSYEERWFHDPTNNSCEPFGYTGCGGNQNNFKNLLSCETFCANYTPIATTTPTPTIFIPLTTRATNFKFPEIPPKMTRPPPQPVLPKLTKFPSHLVPPKMTIPPPPQLIPPKMTIPPPPQLIPPKITIPPPPQLILPKITIPPPPQLVPPKMTIPPLQLVPPKMTKPPPQLVLNKITNLPSQLVPPKITKLPTQLVPPKLTKPPQLSTKDNNVMQNDFPALDEDVDCQMSSWKGWGECFGYCDHGIKLNYRTILNNASLSGRQCPLNLIRIRNCKPHTCHGLIVPGLPSAHHHTEDYDLGFF